MRAVEVLSGPPIMRDNLPRQPSENNRKKARFDLQTVGSWVYKDSMVIVVELSGFRALIKVASFISSVRLLTYTSLFFIFNWL